MTSLRVGVSFRAGGELCPNGVLDLLEYAAMAEDAGFDDFDASDHLLLSSVPPENYPGGVFRWRKDSFWPEPMVLLAAVAARTRRIQLTTSVLVVPLRPAVLVAKMAATLDSLSNGRLRLGIGSGWNRIEFDAVGVPYAGRTKAMEDTIGACRALWSAGVATFESPTVSFDDVESRPLPEHRIPVLVGGAAIPAVADRIARVADGWNPMQSQRSDVDRGIALLRKAFDRYERPPSELSVRVAVPERILQSALDSRDGDRLKRELGELQEIGVTDVKLYLSGAVDKPTEVPGALEWISGELGLDTGIATTL